MEKYLKIFISSMLAGFCIVIGATAYLLCSKESFSMKVVGSLLFGIGLYTIIHFKLWLYTGKVGNTLDNKPKYLLDLVVCSLGNFFGVFVLASLISLTRNGDVLKEISTSLVNTKQNDSWYSIFILSFMCGIMIYLAVKGHEKASYPLAKALFAYLPISVFILCGYEHVIANSCYYTYAHFFNAKSLLYFILMFLGNAAGAIAFDGLLKLIDHVNQKESQ